MAFEKKIKKTFDEAEVSIDKYMDMIFTDAYSVLRETAQTNNLQAGMSVVQLIAYQAEGLAKARKILNKDNLDGYVAAVSAEKERLGADADNQQNRTKLAMFQLQYILSLIEDTKPIAEIGKI